MGPQCVHAASAVGNCIGGMVCTTSPVKDGGSLRRWQGLNPRRVSNSAWPDVSIGSSLASWWAALRKLSLSKNWVTHICSAVKNLLRGFVLNHKRLITVDFACL